MDDKEKEKFEAEARAGKHGKFGQEFYRNKEMAMKAKEPTQWVDRWRKNEDLIRREPWDPVATLRDMQDLGHVSAIIAWCIATHDTRNMSRTSFREHVLDEWPAACKLYSMIEKNKTTMGRIDEIMTDIQKANRRKRAMILEEVIRQIEWYNEVSKQKESPLHENNSAREPSAMDLFDKNQDIAEK